MQLIRKQTWIWPPIPTSATLTKLKSMTDLGSKRPWIFHQLDLFVLANLVLASAESQTQSPRQQTKSQEDDIDSVASASEPWLSFFLRDFFVDAIIIIWCQRLKVIRVIGNQQGAGVMNIGERFMAIRWRTPGYSRLENLIEWCLSVLVMCSQLRMNELVHIDD